MITSRIVHGGLFLMLTVLAEASLGQTAVDWWSIDGGSAVSLTGGGYNLSGTIGQPDAGLATLSGDGYQVQGGFWPGVLCPVRIPGDMDGDCDVDAADFLVFVACAAGPGVPYTGDCARADLDGDMDVDQDDFAVFQRCLSGEGVMGDPGCGG